MERFVKHTSSIVTSESDVTNCHEDCDYFYFGDDNGLLCLLNSTQIEEDGSVPKRTKFCLEHDIGTSNK